MKKDKQENKKMEVEVAEGIDVTKICSECQGELEPEDLLACRTSYVHRGVCQRQKQRTADSNAAEKQRKRAAKCKKADRQLEKNMKRIRKDAPPQSKEELAGEEAWKKGKAIHFSDSGEEMLTEEGLSLAPPSPSEWSALGMSPPCPPMPSTSSEEKKNNKKQQKKEKKTSRTKEFKLGDLSKLLDETAEFNAEMRSDASTSRAGTLEVTLSKSYRDVLVKESPSKSAPQKAWAEATSWKASDLLDRELAPQVAPQPTRGKGSKRRVISRGAAARNAAAAESATRRKIERDATAAAAAAESDKRKRKARDEAAAEAAAARGAAAAAAAESDARERAAAKAAAAEAAAAEAAAAEAAAAEAAARGAAAEAAARGAAAAKEKQARAAAEAAAAEAYAAAYATAMEVAARTAAAETATAAATRDAHGVPSLPPPLVQMYQTNGGWTVERPPPPADPTLPPPPPPPSRELGPRPRPPPPPLVARYNGLTPPQPSHYYTARELAAWERGDEDELEMYGLSGNTEHIVRVIFLDLLTGPAFRREGLRAEREVVEWVGHMIQGATSHADVLTALEGIRASAKAFRSWALTRIKEEYNHRRSRGVIDRGNAGRSHWRGHELLFRRMLKELETYISDVESRVRIGVGCLVTCRILVGKLMCLFRIL